MHITTDCTVCSKALQPTIDWLHFQGHQYQDASTQINRCVFTECRITKSQTDGNFMFRFGKLVSGTDILNGQNSFPDKFRSDAKTFAYPSLGNEFFSLSMCVCVCVYKIKLLLTNTHTNHLHFPESVFFEY